MPETGAEASAAIEVAPGEREVLQDLQFRRPLLVQGSVRTETRPLVGGRVFFVGPNGPAAQGVTDEAGSFRLTLAAPGEYRLLVVGHDLLLHDETLWIDEDLSLSRDLKTTAISGRIVASGTNAPLEGATISIRRGDESTVPTWASSSFSRREVETDFDGRFFAHDLPPGALDLSLESPGYAPKRFSAESWTPLDLGEIPLSALQDAN